MQRNERGQFVAGYPNPKGPDGRFLSRFALAIRESMVDQAVQRGIGIVGCRSLRGVKFNLPLDKLNQLPLIQSIRYAFVHPDDLDFKLLRQPSPQPAPQPIGPEWDLSGPRPVPSFLRRALMEIAAQPTSGTGFTLPDFRGAFYRPEPYGRP